MRSVGLAMLLAIAVTGCSQEPRSAAYFEAHRDEAAKVVAQCAKGSRRGQECINAQAAAKADARDERMQAYERNF